MRSNPEVRFASLLESAVQELRSQWRGLLRAAALPAALALLVNLGIALLPAGSHASAVPGLSSLRGIGLLAADFISTALFTVAACRLFLRREPPPLLPVPSKRHTAVIALLILLTAIVAVPLAIVGTAERLATGAGLGLLPLLFFALAFLVSIRLALAFPMISLDRPNPLRESLERSRGRFFALGAALAIAFVLIALAELLADTLFRSVFGWMFGYRTLGFMSDSLAIGFTLLRYAVYAAIACDAYRRLADVAEPATASTSLDR